MTRPSGFETLTDPGRVRLRRYVSVLAVIAAPYAGLGGNQDPVAPLDHAAEWGRLAAVFEAATLQAGGEASAPLALLRLVPPTAEQLQRVLAEDGPDAPRIVHIVAHGERDMLYLEDDDGYEAYAVTEHIANLFRTSGACVVALDGCFSRRLAQVLLADTPVEAVVGTRRRTAPENNGAFWTAFYAAVAGGNTLSQAFRAGLTVLNQRPDGQADRFELLTAEAAGEVEAPVPPPSLRAERALLVDGQPPTTGVWAPPGFVGRRAVLGEMARDIPAFSPRCVALVGPLGIGKSWLAAEFAARFGWRFPAGVVWYTATALTTLADIVDRLARALDLSPYLDFDDLVRVLNARRLLLVVDQVDAIELSGARDDLSALLNRIDRESGTTVLLTAHHAETISALLPEARMYVLDRFTAKEARTLAMRLAVGRDLDVLDVDSVDEFLDRAADVPFLVAHGINLVQHAGIDSGLDALRAFDRTAADAVYAQVQDQVRRAQDTGGPESMLVLLQRLLAYPGPIAARLVERMAGKHAPDLLGRLRQAGVVVGDEQYLALRPAARDMLRPHALSADQLVALDRAMASYLVRNAPTIEHSPARDVEWRALTMPQRVWLDHARAVLWRHARPASMLDPVLLVSLLVAAAPAFRAVGLAQELLDLASPVRDQVPDGPLVGQLQVVMAEAAFDVPERHDEAGWLFQVTLARDDLDRATFAAVHRAYAAFLEANGQLPDAIKLLSDGLHTLLRERRAEDVGLLAPLAHAWGDTLVRAGRCDEAVPRYEAALSGYAETRQPARSIEARLGLSAALVALDQRDRAEDMLRRALASAEKLRLFDLAGQIRARLATFSAARAGAAAHPDEQHAAWRTTEQLYADALIDRLPTARPAELARLWRALAEVEAVLGRLDDAAQDAARAADIFGRAADVYAEAEALSTYGQIVMARGDAVSAQQSLHHAIDLAAAHDDREVLRRAAGALVRVHQIRARHAAQSDAVFQQDTVEQARYSLAILAGMGLEDHAAALDAVIRRFAGG